MLKLKSIKTCAYWSERYSVKNDIFANFRSVAVKPSTLYCDSDAKCGENWYVSGPYADEFSYLVGIN